MLSAIYMFVSLQRFEGHMQTRLAQTEERNQLQEIPALLPPHAFHPSSSVSQTHLLFSVISLHLLVFHFLV